MEINSLNFIDKVYPIGSIYMSVNSTDPSLLFGGEWESWGNGRMPVSVDTTQTNFATVEKTGGEATHKLTTSEMPAHTHGSKSLSGYVTLSSNIVLNTSAGRLVEAYSGICKEKAANATICYTGVSTTTGAIDNGFYVDATHEHTSVGSGTAHNNLPPYITCYMWKRVA